MNALIDAILKHELQRVRDLMRTNPEFAIARSDAGDLPLDIARSAGDVFVHVTLLRLGAPSDCNEQTDFGSLLIEYVAQWSDACACASWLADIEFIVYATLTGDHGINHDPHGLTKLDGESLADLRYLKQQGGRWPHWDSTDGSVYALSLAEWEPIYRAWKTQ